ncbi:MAG: Uma2 family endonuclease [Cyanobacteria bacterium J06632_3]
MERFWGANGMQGEQQSFVFQGRRFFENDSLVHIMPQEVPPRSPRETLPTMYDLPSEFPEEPGLPDEFHDLQPQLLSQTLLLEGYTKHNCFTASDLNVYYDIAHPLRHKRPDWFLAVGVPRMYEGKDLRRSYVAWQEEAAPHVIVEFLSEGTEQEDLGRFYKKNGENQPQLNLVNDRKNKKTPGKLEAYERYLRVPHYIIYSRHSGMLRYLKLEGSCYQEQALQDGNCRIWLDDLQVGLGIWEGEFDDVLHNWLRWCSREGEWLLTEVERSQQAEEKARAQLIKAAQNLLATGMDIGEIANLLELSDEQIQQVDRQ